MSDTITLITSLIQERPMCLPCIAARAGTTETTVRALLARIVPIVWYGERCRACGQTGIVVSLIHQSVA